MTETLICMIFFSKNIYAHVQHKGRDNEEFCERNQVFDGKV